MITPCDHTGLDECDHTDYCTSVITSPPTRLDKALVARFKERAEAQGIGYQTLIKAELRAVDRRLTQKAQSKATEPSPAPEGSSAPEAPAVLSLSKEDVDELLRE